MQFQSKQKRIFWLNLIASTAFDILIAGVCSLILGEWSAFWIVLIGLNFAYFSVWLRSFLWSWITYKFYRRNVMVEEGLRELKKAKMPQPDDYMDDAPSYFSQVMKDEKVDVDKRIFATAYFQSMAILQAYGFMKEYMQVSLAAERAIEQYKGTFEE